MQIALLVILAIASVWAAVAATLGSIVILGTGAIPVIAALLFTALVLAFLLGTRWIVQWQGNFPGALLKFFWFVALGYGLYTTWVGNRNLIIGVGRPTTAQAFLLTGLTLLLVSSPIVLSWLWARRLQLQTLKRAEGEGS
jgi:hypothetical protein